jgi:hypothetical protein
MKKQSFFRRNGLSVVIFGIFLLFLSGQTFFGLNEYNNEMLEKGGRTVDLPGYLCSAHFLEATFENWESEFLQMGMYVLFTVFLYQRGSSESKAPGRKEEVDREPIPHKNAPWPVHKGGIWLKLYKNSLFIAFMLLFIISFSIHVCASHREHNKEQLLQGRGTESLAEFFTDSRLWFESFQNWQSEFIAVFSIVVLSIFFRQQGSPESKPVDAPDYETGE